MTAIELFIQTKAKNRLETACSEASSGAAMPSTFGSKKNETKDYVKNKTLDIVAEALAAGYIGEKYGKEELSKSREAELNAKMEKRKQQTLQDPGFKAVMENLDLADIRDMLGNPENYMGRKHQFSTEMVEKTKMMYNPVSYSEFMLRFNKKLQTPEVQQRKQEIQKEMQQKRFGSLVTDLEQSTQKSFTGRLKSFFVGDSKEYKAAFKAMKDLSEGKVTSPKDMKATKAAIENYIMNRSGVRNHEYGQKRFDAFMKGLGQIMDPVEFRECCDSVSRLRHERNNDYSHDLEPENYLPEESKERYRKTVAEFDTVAAQARADEQRVLADMKANELHTGKDGNIIQNAVTERNQEYLDKLRKLRPEDLEKNQKMIDGMNARLREHPSFRPLAAKVIKENGLGDMLKVPKTYPDLMDIGFRATLNDQAKAQQEMDQEKHPELYKQQPQKDQKQELDRQPRRNMGGEREMT